MLPSGAEAIDVSSQGLPVYGTTTVLSPLVAARDMPLQHPLTYQSVLVVASNAMGPDGASSHGCPGGPSGRYCVISPSVVIIPGRSALIDLARFGATY
jgi:hypothetical protein